MANLEGVCIIDLLGSSESTQTDKINVSWLSQNGPSLWAELPSPFPSLLDSLNSFCTELFTNEGRWDFVYLKNYYENIFVSLSRTLQ